MTVLFRVAAGPRLGFGHLRRALSLARALGTTPRVSVRGVTGVAAAARRLGCRVEAGGPGNVLARAHPTVLVIDDPCARRARPWLLAAKRRGIPVASVHDLGLAWIASDLLVDGTVVFRNRRGPKLLGAAFMPIDPAVADARRKRRAAARGALRVLIALGGGPRRARAASLARAIARVLPDARIRVAGGFMPAGGPGRHVTWLAALPTLAHEIQAADVVVVSGGVTLYEAWAIGTPAVAVAVTGVSAQRRTVEAGAARRMARDGGALDDSGAPGHVARQVKWLLINRKAAQAQARRARHVVDGRGALRVAAALVRLARNPQQPRAEHP